MQSQYPEIVESREREGGGVTSSSSTGGREQRRRTYLSCRIPDEAAACHGTGFLHSHGPAATLCSSERQQAGRTRSHPE